MRIKLTLLITLLFSLNLHGQKQTGTVLIKTVEVYGTFSAIKKEVIVIDELDVVSVTELDKHNKEGIAKNLTKLKETLDMYLAVGYQIISSTANSFGHSGSYVIEHTYILQEAEVN